MISDQQKINVKKYKSKNIVKTYIELNKNTDDDIIKHLSMKVNKQGYIKQLIRKDMQAQKKTSKD